MRFKVDGLRKQINSVLFFDSILIFALVFLLILIYSYIIRGDFLKELYVVLHPVINVIFPETFVKFLIKKGGVFAEISLTYMLSVYIVFLIIFSTAALAQSRNSTQSPTQCHAINLQGLFNRIHECFYTGFIVPLSFSFIKQQFTKIGETQKILTFKELFQKYPKNLWLEYIYFYIFVGLIFLPWLVIDSLSEPTTFFPFWIAVLACAYVQIRFLFEIVMLSKLLIIKTQ